FTGCDAGCNSDTCCQSITVSERVDGYLTGSPVTLTLYVHSGSASGPFLSGVLVTGTDGVGQAFSQTTGSAGYVTITGGPGTWQFTASEAGYNTATWSQSITVSERLDGYLTASGVTLTLYVHSGSASGPVLSGALVTGTDGAGQAFSQTTGSAGSVTITGTPGTWHFTASEAGYTTSTWSQSITVSERVDGYLTTSGVTLSLYIHSGSASGPVLSGALVTGTDGAGQAFSQTTGSAGSVTITGTPGAWHFTASEAGYTTSTWSQSITVSERVDAYLTGLPVALTLYIHSGSASGPVLSGALVTGTDGAGQAFSQTTGSAGSVTITGTPGTWHFTASEAGYTTSTWSQSITVSERVDGYLTASGVTLSLYIHSGSASGPVLSGVLVTGTDGAGQAFSQTTGSAGYVTITGGPGTWQFTASEAGYNTATWSQSITVSERLDGYLTASGVTLTLYVHSGSASGPVLSGALVTGTDGAGQAFSQTTGGAGYVTITGTPGTWQFTASKAGYRLKSWSQSI